MAKNLAAGIACFQFLDELDERGLLLGRSGVLAMIAAILSLGRLATTDVADSDAVSVVGCSMCAYLCFGSACMDATIAIDDPVITDALPASILVPSVNVLDGEVLALGCRGAMDDN